MRKIIPVLLFVCICFACNNSKPNADNTDNITSQSLVGGEPFSEFIEKFHSDSLFAMTRIAEKTEGFSSDLVVFDSLQDDFVGGECFWTKEEMRSDWCYINYIRQIKDEYKVKYEMRNDSAFECVYIPESDCLIDIIFKLKNKEWYLVYLSHNNL